ncbi:MAG: hypothetical protein RIS08_644, partial [Actinomycetota bacterium]
MALVWLTCLMDGIRVWFQQLDSASRKKLLLGLLASAVVLYLLVNQDSGKVEVSESAPSNQVEFSGSLYVHVVGEVAEP